MATPWERDGLMMGAGWHLAVAGAEQGGGADALESLLWAALADQEVPGKVMDFLRNGDVLLEPAVPIPHPELSAPAHRVYAGVLKPQPAEGALFAFRLDGKWSPTLGRSNPEAIRGTAREIDLDEYRHIMGNATLAAMEKTLDLSGREAEVEASERRLERIKEEFEDRKNRELEQARELMARAAQGWKELQVREAEFEGAVKLVNSPGAQRFFSVIEHNTEDRRVGPVSLKEGEPPSDFLRIISRRTKQAGLSLPDVVVRRAVLAWLISAIQGQIMILAGPPGTGKTSLATTLAKIANTTVTKIPVRPGWLDSSDLLGYFDSRQDRFIAGPLVDSLLRVEDSGEEAPLHTVVLDELNIARIENYGADLLAELEKTREADDQGALQLYAKTILEAADRELVEAQSKVTPDSQSLAAERVRRLQTIEPTLDIPPNLSLIGTLNDDDTTYRLSPKVIDRSLGVKIPYTRPSIGASPTGAPESDWTITRAWLDDIVAPTGGDQVEAAELWKVACEVIAPAEGTTMRLSHRSAKCVALLPSLSRALCVPSDELLDDLLVLKVLPWISITRSESRKIDELRHAVGRAEGKLKGFSRELGGLVNGSDEIVQYLR